MRWLLLVFSLTAWAQDTRALVARGERIFEKSCATGYCHASKGATGGGAPRLAARGFDGVYITNTTTRGLPGTAMPPFGTTLERADLLAVVAYVETLNGIAPVANAPAAAIVTPPPLPPQAVRGRDLFFDAVRGFGRCSTCHQVIGLGIPVAGPITTIPATVAALRALPTPHVSTVTAEGETMPALVVSQGSRGTMFYDLTSSPPVLRTMDSGVQVAPGSKWSHASALGAYNDAELSSILAFLKRTS